MMLTLEQVVAIVIGFICAVGLYLWWYKTY